MHESQPHTPAPPGDLGKYESSFEFLEPESLPADVPTA